MSDSIANGKYVDGLAKYLGKRIPEIAETESPKAWTHAVHKCFREIARMPEWNNNNVWKMYPSEKENPGKGEFLLDFVLYEKGYGPRIVCESQWQHSKKHIKAIEWAFDKLQCVKGDIKVLIYECPDPPTKDEPPVEVAKIIRKYLHDIQLFSPEEAFLFLNLSSSGKSAHWWKPTKSGEQEKIIFKPIHLDKK